MPPKPPQASNVGVDAAHGPSTRNSSGSNRSPAFRRQNSGQQLSQIEKSVTHLLVATKQLLETLTQWSRQTATEAEVSDVYVRLGYEFNIACRAFTAIGVETADLGNVPDALRSVLEETLSQEASPKSLDQYLPHIRDIIINLLHGLKRKQQKLREKQSREAGPPNGIPARNDSMGSVGSTGSGLTQMLDDIPSQYTSGGTSQSFGRGTSKESLSAADEPGIPPRNSSVAGGRSSPSRQDHSQSRNIHNLARSPPSNRDTQLSHHTTSSSMSSTTMQNIPVLGPQSQESLPSKSHKSSQNTAPFPPPPPPPPPPPKQDALTALQRGGDLERRASRRYSAYQISKHFGVSPTGVPTIPSSQNSPIPNRGRDARESMNAVRIRGSLLHSRQKSTNRPAAESSSNGDNALSSRISEESFQSSTAPTIHTPEELPAGDISTPKSSEKGRRPSEASKDSRETPIVRPTIKGGPNHATGALNGDVDEGERLLQKRPPGEGSISGDELQENHSAAASSSPRQSRQFVPEQSPEPGKELTLFLQYKSKIKKFVLPDGLNELSIARLQLAFIEKFAWNTHSNGNDLPEIYIQDPVSGVRHELEDLSDVKDRSVLVLNVEVLDEVKRHIDEGLGGLRKIVEGVRNVVDGQQLMIQRVSDRQQEAAKDMAALAIAPVSPPPRQAQADAKDLNGARASGPTAGNITQLNEIKNLRRDLAVMRQTYSSFVSDIETSMSTIRQKASSVKTVAIKAAIPELGGESGRAYVNAGKKTLGDDSDRLVARVDDLQDVVEDLRKDVVTRGVRPLPRQLEDVGRDISLATAELKKMQEYLKREKPIWTKIWEKELELVCTDRDLLTMQEELAADLEDDLEKATQTFALVEQCTKEQLKDGQGAAPRSVSRGLSAIPLDTTIDPRMAKEGVLGEVRALQPNHENRLEAIERAEKLRQKELESRRGGEFQKELGSFVEEGKLKKSGGVEEAERLRKVKDDRIRKEVWEKQNAKTPAKEQGTTTPAQAVDGLRKSPEMTFLDESDFSPTRTDGPPS
ncbi:MAG: Bud site selection protein 6 [Geoglossum umbratile]|nr:MAG: Bud site selection protein 6 [Geoglossum umbratile]